MRKFLFVQGWRTDIKVSFSWCVLCAEPCEAIFPGAVLDGGYLCNSHWPQRTTGVSRATLLVVYYWTYRNCWPLKALPPGSDLLLFIPPVDCPKFEIMRNHKEFTLGWYSTQIVHFGSNSTPTFLFVLRETSSRS